MIKLLIIFLVALYCNVLNAKDFEKYQCNEENSTGFKYNRSTDDYTQGIFENRKFNLLLYRNKENYKIVERVSVLFSNSNSESHTCRHSYFSDIVLCVNNQEAAYPTTFNINIRTGAFNYTTAMGNLENWRDELRYLGISMGRCYKK